MRESNWLWTFVGLVIVSQVGACDGCGGVEKKRAKGMTTDGGSAGSGGRPTKGGKPVTDGGAPNEQAGAPSSTDAGTGGSPLGGSASGGTPSVDGAPVIVTQPNDVTLIERQVGQFSVTATGDDLTYQWECHLPEQPFMAWPYATSEALILDSPPISQNGLVCRVIIENEHGSVTSAEARLTVLPAEVTTGIRLETASGFEQEDAVMASLSSDSYLVSGNLGTGTLGSAVYSFSLFEEAVARLDVSFSNDAAVPITIDAGQLSAHVTGSYEAFSSQNGSDVRSSVTLTVYPEHHPGDQLSVGYQHLVALSGAALGPVMETHVLTPSAYADGVVSTVESMTALDVDLSLPAIELEPGEGFRLAFELTTSAFVGTANFAATPATLQLVLPAGVTLESSASVPLSWVTSE